MTAHLLLSYAAAPLLVLGWRARPVSAWLSAPLPAFLAFNAVTYGLHVPAVHHALMTPWGYGLQGVLFLASGVWFWAAARGGLSAVALLLGQMAACSLLGAAVTFSRGVYPMTVPADSALGGVLMWVAGGLVVMAAALAHVFFLLTERLPAGIKA